MKKGHLLIAILLPMLSTLSHCVPYHARRRIRDESSENQAAPFHIFVPVTADARLSSGLIQQLTDKGFAINEKESDPNDIRISINTNTTKKKSIVTVVVNGQVRVNHETTAVVEIFVNQNLVDTAIITFDPEDGPSPGDIRDLVDAIGGSKVLEPAYQAREQARAAQAGRERRMADAWISPEVVQCLALGCDKYSPSSTPAPDCKEPTDEHACDAIEKFILLYPNGSHTEEARQALAKFNKALAVYRDEKAWRESKWSTCEKAQTPQDCEGVREYQRKFPQGAHSSGSLVVLRKGERSMLESATNQAWTSANPEACAAAQKDDACDSLRSFLEGYPNSSHDAEARSFLQRGEAATGGRRRTQSCAGSCAATCSTRSAAEKGPCIDYCKQQCK